MTRLEDLQPNAAVRGILPDSLVTVVSVQWFGSEALELTYKTPADIPVHRRHRGTYAAAAVFPLVAVSYETAGVAAVFIAVCCQRCSAFVTGCHCVAVSDQAADAAWASPPTIGRGSLKARSVKGGAYFS